MHRFGSDFDEKMSDDQIRTICAGLLKEEVAALQVQFESMVSSTVTTVQTEAKSITDAFTKNFEECLKKPAVSMNMMSYLHRWLHLVVANSQSSRPVQVQSTQFDRETDGTIARVAAGQLVSHAGTFAALTPRLSEFGLDAEKYELQPPDPLSKQFVFKFTGAAGLAAHRAGKVKLEILGRKTKMALQTELRGHKAFFDRDRGWISIGRDALGKIEPKQGKGKADIMWN
ncbi:unnamed protein product [Prorocentrum cordatum]|uniref:Uncharacterized protein n=1 Tax=Prorocentrum cordatum TaxID=2364126 RepID=A0ABN9TE87_9DINO|nr:unnamed protein product [Polarella glacialis]